jgi:hypothetical protein
MLTDYIPYYSPLFSGVWRIRKIQKKWMVATASADIALPTRHARKFKAPKISAFHIENERGSAVSFDVDMSYVGGTTAKLEKGLDTIVAVMGAYTGQVEKHSPGLARMTIRWDQGRFSVNPLAAQLEDGAFDLTQLALDLDQARIGRALISISRSILIGGESGSGKSNEVWALLAQLNEWEIPYRLWVIDPAGGVEMADLEDGRYTVEYTDRPPQIEPMILKFHAAMEQRLDSLKKRRIRLHQPSPQEPMEILIIDELLLCRDQIKQGPLSPMGECLTVGRKAAFVVWACTQLGQKDVVGQMRDLFPQRVCFRTQTAESTDAILGNRASVDGAQCERIADPGRGYVFTEASGRFERFQAPEIVETKSIAGGGIALPPNIQKTRRPAREHAGTTYLYKLFDTDEPTVTRPAYIGIANNPKRRLGEHAKDDSRWFETIVMSRTEILMFATREQAEEMETQLIEYYQPVWNVRGKGPST